MRSTLFVILLLVAPRGVIALTWDFDDGSTWGWTARESSSYSTQYTSEPLRSEVVDGVWRIAPAPTGRPTVQLRSPLIGEDSALFDRLTLRLRLIHHSPTEELFGMVWSNAEYRRLSEGFRFSTGRQQSYPIEWEDITIDLRALAADPEWKISWQDTLFNIRITMLLYRDSQDVDNHPKFLEIDWIQLTGAEELAQGELSPRDIGVEVGSPGTLFAEPNFFPLGEGIGIPNSRRFSRRDHLQISQGAVGDIDGDGDADLVVFWRRLADREIQQGWTVASNDGLGGFEPTQEVTLSTASFRDYTPSIDLRGSDFDGDGLLDLVVDKDLTVELWYNWGDGFDPALQLSSVDLVGLADGDGDGNVDLLVSDLGYREVSLWINDGYDFVSSDTFGLDSEEILIPYLPAGQPLGEAASLLWNGKCYFPLQEPQAPQGPWQLTRPWAASQPPPLSFEAAVDPCALHLMADLDGNGTVDLLGSPERIETFFETNYYGLTLWRLDASGVLARHSLLDWKAFPLHAATTSDLNGDGLLDVALVVGNSTVGSGASGVARPTQRRTRPRRPLPPARRGRPDFRQRCQRRWRHRSGRAGNQSRKRPRRRLCLDQPRHPGHGRSDRGGHANGLCFRGELSQSVQPRHDHPLGRARRSEERGLNHLQCPRAANAPSMDGSATRWRTRTNLGWPRRAGPTRRRWSLCVSLAGGRADAHPQNGQTRIGQPISGEKRCAIRSL